MERWRARFFTIRTGQSMSLVGSVAAQFALVWWLTKETGSATVPATASLVALAPSIVLRPFIGAVVDPRPLADTIGVKPWFAIAGGVLAVGALCGLWIPSLSRIEAEAESRSAHHTSPVVCTVPCDEAA